MNQRRTITLLAGLAIGMFAFGFALVPLYNVFCSITGFNGGGSNRVAIVDFEPGEVDTSRTITIQFDSTLNTGLPWEFKPMVREMKIHPGEVYEVAFYAENVSGQDIVGQAIPGVSPWQASNYLNKTECFCFTEQPLAAGESKEMPLRFFIDPALPEGISTVTLSYTFMNKDRQALKNNKPIALNNH